MRLVAVLVAFAALTFADMAVAAVKRPQFVRNIETGETGWFSSPALADLADRDGRLEIVVSTFDHGIDVYRVPRSRPNRLPWPTGRGNLLRTGTP